ncbi:hypothetical protein BZM27_53640, partial [Paraburkholderia steynii]
LEYFETARIVALFLGAGISAAELRQAHRCHVVVDGARPNVYISKRGARDQRRVTLPLFALPALRRWKDAKPSADDALLFPAPGQGGVMNDVLLGTVVKTRFEGIGFVAPDMSPRILRNTFARRQLLSGRSNEDTSGMLGLVSRSERLRVCVPRSAKRAQLDFARSSVGWIKPVYRDRHNPSIGVRMPYQTDFADIAYPDESGRPCALTFRIAITASSERLAVVHLRRVNPRLSKPDEFASARDRILNRILDSHLRGMPLKTVRLVVRM